MFALQYFTVLKAVDEFICELRLRETNPDKRRKIAALALDEDEWTRVRLFSNILQVCLYTFLSIGHIMYIPQHADNSQHAFSASSRPTLHNTLPALERLYSEWEKASKKARYEKFKPALVAGMAKLDEYYQRSGTSDAHIIVMGRISVT